MGLSDGERISMIRSAVLIQYTRVTDGHTQTDRQTDGIGVAYTRYSIYAVARKNSCKIYTVICVFHCFSQNAFVGSAQKNYWGTFSASHTQQYLTGRTNGPLAG